VCVCVQYIIHVLDPIPPAIHDEQSEFLEALNPHLRSQVKKSLLDFSRVHLQKEIGKGLVIIIYSLRIQPQTYHTFICITLLSLAGP